MRRLRVWLHHFKNNRGVVVDHKSQHFKTHRELADVVVCTSVSQHSCSHRGRCVPGGDCGPPTPLQTPLDEDQSASPLGRAFLPFGHVSLCVHHRRLHRGSHQQEPDHLHLESQPYKSHGEFSVLSCF